VLHRLRRFGQSLGKGELRLERASGQVTLVVELACIRYPLIDQDQAGAVGVKQLPQHVTGARGFLVIGA
jgi:hypothetical protein